MFIEASQVPVEQLGGGVTRQVLAHDAHLMTVRVDFEAGAIGKLHSHPHRQSSYIAAGRFEVEIGGEKRVLGPGDCYFPAPDVPHGVLALTAGTLIDTFTPRRDDFLPKKGA